MGLAEMRMPIFFTSGKTMRMMASVLVVDRQPIGDPGDVAAGAGGCGARSGAVQCNLRDRRQHSRRHDGGKSPGFSESQ